jgi:hypothetical protein
MARTGKGTRLRSIINIKGDICRLLFSGVSMTPKCAMPRPDEYLQRRGSQNCLISRGLFSDVLQKAELKGSSEGKMPRKRRKLLAACREFPPPFEGERPRP